MDQDTRARKCKTCYENPSGLKVSAHFTFLDEALELYFLGNNTLINSFNPEISRYGRLELVVLYS